MSNGTPLQLEELLKEVRELNDAGEMPDKVSMRLLWAAVIDTGNAIREHDEWERENLLDISKIIEVSRSRISVLEWAASAIGLAILGLAAKAFFG